MLDAHRGDHRHRYQPVAWRSLVDAEVLDVEALGLQHPVGAVFRPSGDSPFRKEGDELTVEFSVAGVSCIGLNGGPAFKHNEPFRFRSPPTINWRPIGGGTPSAAMAARKALAAGAKTGKASLRKSRRAC